MLAAAVGITALPLQFITPGHGSVLAQSLVPGSVQAGVGVGANAVIAGAAAAFLGGRPVWMAAQSGLMGTVRAGLAVRMATEARRRA